MVEFITKNYLLVIIVAAFLIFALIGFIVDSAKNKKDAEAQVLTETMTEEEMQAAQNISNIPVTDNSVPTNMNTEIPDDSIPEAPKDNNKK